MWTEKVREFKEPFIYALCFDTNGSDGWAEISTLMTELKKEMVEVSVLWLQSED